MKIKLFYLLLVFLPAMVNAQTGRTYAGLTAGKEFDIMNLNHPYMVQSVIRFFPLYLQAEYKFDNARITAHQVTESTMSYGARVGFFISNKKEDGLSGLAFHAGILDREEYKKIIFTADEYPTDALGNVLDVDQFQVLTQARTYVLGITVLQILLNDGKNLESVMDDFDIKLLKKRKRYNQLLMTLEAMYQPTTNFSNTGVYNPYNFFVDREIRFSPEFKHKKFGVNFKMEYTGPLHMGFFTQMGVFPGISHKSEDYLDFNFACRVGVLMNVALFKKLRDE